MEDAPKPVIQLHEQGMSMRSTARMRHASMELAREGNAPAFALYDSRMAPRSKVGNARHGMIQAAETSSIQGACPCQS